MEMPFKHAIVLTLCLPVFYQLFGQTDPRIPTPGPASHASSRLQTTDSGSAQTRILGEVVEIDATTGRLIIKNEGEKRICLLSNEKTEFLRVPPGDQSLERAVRISLVEIQPGDLVYARGRLDARGLTALVQRVVVMLKADIQKKQHTEREEWRLRGIVGVITSLDPQARTMTLLVGRQRSVVISQKDIVRYRRYSQDSVSFDEAKPGTFDELRVGDQLRAMGERSTDGSRFLAEQVVSGSFKTVGAVVTAVARERKEIEATVLGTRQPVTVAVAKNSILRRIPPEQAVIMAQSNQKGDATENQDRIDRLPIISLDEIKPGDVIAISATNGPDPSRITAIVLLTGIDAVLSALQRRSAPSRQVSQSTGLPPGVLEFRIGQP